MDGDRDRARQGWTSDGHLPSTVDMSAEVDTGRTLTCERALARLTGTWEVRSQVRRFVLPAAERFDSSKPDFPEELLPFGRHPAFSKATEAERERVLSLAWIAYNAKTIDIEKGILTPACVATFEGRPFGDRIDENARRAAVQTLVDETYHVLITHHAARLTRVQRDLTAIRVPHCKTIESMWRLQAQHPEAWKKDIILIATAIVTEVFICGYLRGVSSARDIQPLNVETTRAHLLDELGHAREFRLLTEMLYGRMRPKEREFFLSVVPEPVVWFADRELDTWEALLEQIAFPDRRAILGDCRAAQREAVDYTALIKLLEGIGVSDVRNRISH